MRFTETGPSIPNELLDERDAGGVVFLCGAGISIPAGFPDFYKLTLGVAKRLGVAPDSEPGQLITAEKERRISGSGEPVSFDRIFTQLIRTYGRSQVEAEVAGMLSAIRRPSLLHHRALLDLARAPDGRQRLVTTNFDLLFQKAQRRVRTYAPPHLPDLSYAKTFDGVVHLHGMLPATSVRQDDQELGLILSSADFGRAYLAEAWATRFMRELLDQFTVVLLGYSADDPPVRYLLEGLNITRRDGRIYAFAAGDNAPVEAQWRERGVKAIAYQSIDRSHRPLWEAIHGWADRARDPVSWRKRIVALAQTAPRQLRPFERGQVAALCSSKEGAEAFASSQPPPPAEWLCVFDSRCRYRAPGRVVKDGQSQVEEIDPLDEYRLDDDPPRPHERDQRPPGPNVLGPLQSDDALAPELGIMIGHRRTVAPLNPRLFQIARWINATMSSTAAVWWAANYGPLHSQLFDQLCWTVERADVSFHPVVRLAWNLVLEAQASAPDDVREGWYGVHTEIRTEGWTSRSVRAFAQATRPRIATQQSFAPLPPVDSNDLTLSQIAQFNVAYPKLLDGIATVPDEVLATVIRQIRRNLEYGGTLEKEIGYSGLPLPTLFPERKPGEHHESDREEYFTTFAKLFERLVNLSPRAARREFEFWDVAVRFFVPLRLWALADKRIVSSGRDVGHVLRKLSQDEFWDPHHTRELLWTLRARWASLSKRDKLALEARIVKGRPKYKNESKKEFGRRRATSSALRLIWMINAGLKLSKSTRARIPHLKKANPEWCDSWAEGADESFVSRAGWVERITDASPLSNLPISQVLARCDELSKRILGEFKDRDPFHGLVQEAPQKALAVLAFEARRKNYPEQYWSTLLNAWPKTATAKRTLQLAKAIGNLPADLVANVKYPLTDWISTNYQNLDSSDRKVAQRAFDQRWPGLFGQESALDK